VARAASNSVKRGSLRKAANSAIFYKTASMPCTLLQALRRYCRDRSLFPAWAKSFASHSQRGRSPETTSAPARRMDVLSQRYQDPTASPADTRSDRLSSSFFENRPLQIAVIRSCVLPQLDRFSLLLDRAFPCFFSSDRYAQVCYMRRRTHDRFLSARWKLFARLVEACSCSCVMPILL